MPKIETLAFCFMPQLCRDKLPLSLCWTSHWAFFSLLRLSPTQTYAIIAFSVGDFCDTDGNYRGVTKFSLK